MAGATTSAERIEILDGLRGFALFGILLANILITTRFLDSVRKHQLLCTGRFSQLFLLPHAGDEP